MNIANPSSTTILLIAYDVRLKFSRRFYSSAKYNYRTYIHGNCNFSEVFTCASRDTYMTFSERITAILHNLMFLTDF